MTKSSGNGECSKASSSTCRRLKKNLDGYKYQFVKLCDALSGAGLKPSRNLPLPTRHKVLVFLLKVTRAETAQELTRAQWDDFFVRVEAIKATEVGMVGLATLVNRANGLADDDGKAPVAESSRETQTGTGRRISPRQVG